MNSQFVSGQEVTVKSTGEHAKIIKIGILMIKIKLPNGKHQWVYTSQIEPR